MIAPPDRRQLEALARETGYRPVTLEKAARLLGLLQAIAGDAFLGSRLALKGGTALNAFHLDLPRLSVDIDLNYVGALDRETMLAEKPAVETGLQRLLVEHGYALARRPTEHAGGKWRTRFASALGGGNASLEVDVGYMARQPLFGVAAMPSAALGDFQARDIPVVDVHEVVAGKLVALADRGMPRDLFDARSILAMDGLDRRRIKAALLALGAAARRDWRTVTDGGLRVSPPELLEALAICLPQNRFSDAPELHAWMRETLSLCRKRLAPLYECSDDEQAFLDGVLERGEVDAGLLDIEPEVQARIAAMPMLAWKCRHVRQRRGRGA